MRKFITLPAGLLMLMLSSLGACDNAPAGPSPVPSGGGGAGGMGGAGGGGGVLVCDSANLPLDTASLVQLAFDDGQPGASVRLQTWSVTSDSGTYALNEVVLNEAARFELEHPAEVYGFEVMWAELPPDVDPGAALEAGLYRDFGSNGFDFWAPDPLWTGSRCAGEVVDGQWLRYVFDQPIVIDEPGLVYVAHQAAPADPVWSFDLTAEVANPDKPCAKFDECTSAYNLPEVDAGTYFNGLSFPFQYDFMVRLWVKYTDNVQPADKVFAPVLNGPTGRHASWGDYDQDGFDDLLAGGTLYHNEGDGSFTDVTAVAGLGGLGATGGVWGDYDNDGCLDLLLFAEAYSTTDKLMHSDCAGSFTDVTVAAGITDNQSYNDCGDPNNTASPSAAAGWVDIDADGYLDLYLANFICWNDYSFYTDTVFHNQGDGSFSEITSQNGFSSIKSPSRGVAPVDADGDGDVDIFVNNYTLKPNLYFDNQGDGSVLEVGKTVGLAGHANGFYFGHTIGAAWGDLDGDGDFDNVSANLAHPRFFDFSDKTQVLINDGSGQFTDNAGDWLTPDSDNGLLYRETHSVPVLADFDQDGVLDLVITCVYDGRPTDYYWGNGDGTFRHDSYHAGITTDNGWGAAAADYDHDGDMDLFADTLFTNTDQAGPKGHWLQARVVGVTANWAAIGATVRVSAGGKLIMRHVQGGSGKGGQDSLYLHFGLGAASSVEQIEVVFPGGATVTYPGPIGVDQRVWLHQDSVVATAGWTDPG